MKKYLTEFVNTQGTKYGWEVLAESLSQAQALCLERGIGEVIIGQAC